MKFVNKDSFELDLGSNVKATIYPEILCIERNPSEIEPHYHKELKYPVVTGAWIKYNNNLNLKFERYHNIYLDIEIGKFFVDLFDELFFLEDVSNYKIKKTQGKHGYTIDNVLQ